jgi:hypothetical protein
MIKIKNDNLLTPLSELELISLNGGKPDEDTGFWYDAFYIITASILINPRPTSWATSINPY